MRMMSIAAMVALLPMGCLTQQPPEGQVEDVTMNAQEHGEEEATGAENGETANNGRVVSVLDEETREWLETELDRQMAELQEQYPTTEEDKARYRELIMSADPVRSPDDEVSWKVVREYLPQALPVIHEILQVAEDSVRVEAVRSISLPELPEGLAALPNWRETLHGIEPALEPGLLMLLLGADDPERGLRIRTAIFAGHMLALNRLSERDREQPVISERTGQVTLEVLRRMAASDPDKGIRDAAQRALYKLDEGPRPEGMPY